MRTLFLSFLLASAAATPVLAAPSDDVAARAAAREEREQAREERQQAREQRAAPASQPAARPERVERPMQNVQQPVDRQARIQQIETRRDGIDANRAQHVGQIQQRIDQYRDNRDLRQSARPLPRVSRDRPPVISNVPREGTQPPPPQVSRNHMVSNWNTGWRNNRQYDWNNYRNHHRSQFHLGFYYDPFGWGYSPFQIGWRMWPSYYNSSFWINDPYYYRLPYAPPGYQWIRYYDDAVLVDTWSGQVVDVIYEFFW